jgi:phosphoglycolate phosphatase
MTKTIIFDFDGTVADTFESSIETLNTLADKYGFKKFEKEEIKKLRSKSMQEIVKDLHIPLLKLPAAIHDFTSSAQKTICSQQPINEIPQLLHELNAKSYDLNIITSNSVENVSLFLMKHRLNVFNHIYSDRSLFGKHILISKFLKKYQINSEDALYVGDEIRDIEAAHKANIKIISVTWGFNSEEALQRSFPDYIINQPKDMLGILERINSSKPGALT